MTTDIQTKRVLIWSRVSTKGQREISPDTQISHCQRLIKEKGYPAAIKIFNLDYCCLDLSISKEFQQLESMVENHEIDVIVCYDRDRLMADGIDRLVFEAQLKEANIELLICYGPPIIDSDEGQIVELALALGKKRSVLRARTGAKDGLHARVTLKKKPANHHHCWGFNWEIGNRERLIPNSDYDHTKFIFDLALGGAGYEKIVRELAKKGILSPRGSARWSKGRISSLLRNTVYAGRYYALKTRVVRDNKPGKKTRQVPESEQVYLPEVEVVNPPITWAQREALLAQLQRHMLMSKRHANHEYLLRGLVECQQHVGARGQHLKYHGRPLKNSYGYICEASGHPHNFIDGPKLEKFAKNSVYWLFALDIKDKDDRQTLWDKIQNLEKVNRSQLEVELKEKQTKLAKIFKKEALLEDSKFEGKTDEQVYDLLHTQYHMERLDIESGIKETQSLLDSTDRIAEKVESWQAIREKFLDKAACEFTDSQWRELLVEVDCRILISSNSDINWESAFGNKDHKHFPPEISELFEKEVGTHDEAWNLPGLNAVMFLNSPLQLQPQNIHTIAFPEPGRTVR